MELYAATILFALEWYVYPVIILCVAVPMAVVWVIEHRREKRENERRLIFPEPCFTHMGRTADGREIWCHDIYGHDGGHTSEWGLTQEEVNEDLTAPGGPDLEDAEQIWPVKEWKARPDTGPIVTSTTMAPAPDLDLFAEEPEDHTTFENLRPAQPEAPDRCTGEDVAGNQCFYSAGHGGEHYIRSYPPVEEHHIDTPEEPGTPGGLCAYGENGRGNESACWKYAGHDGPHVVEDHNSGEYSERD